MQQMYLDIAFVLKIRLNYPWFTKNIIYIEEDSEILLNHIIFLDKTKTTNLNLFHLQLISELS